MTFGLYQITETVDEFQYEWEESYLEGTRDHIFPNTFESLEKPFELFDENETVPELECYDVGHLYNVKHFLERGHFAPPIHIQFVMGIHGGISADQANLNHMVTTANKLFGETFRGVSLVPVETNSSLEPNHPR